MKTLSLFTLFLLLCTTLTARENPFEATNAYEEEAARIIEMHEVEENYSEEFQQEQQYINTMYEKMNKVEDEKNMMAKEVEKHMEKHMKNHMDKPTKNHMDKHMENKETLLTEEKVKKLIKKAQKETEAKTRKIVKKVIQKPKKVEQIVYVKPRLDVVHEKEILPFVKIEYDNDRIDIHSKYKILKKLTLPGKNKIILDYKAKERFYTKREILNSTNFTKIAIGNHKKDKFFRIVIELSSSPESYEVTYDGMLVSIIRLNEEQ